MIERERERKENPPFSGDFTGFCWSALGRRRVKAALLICATVGVPESTKFVS